MSLLLSLLGTTAIVTSTISTPIVVNQQNQVSPQLNKSGIYQIVGDGNYHASEAGASSSIDSSHWKNTRLLHVIIPWSDLGIDSKKYSKINWSISTLALRLTLEYQNNIRIEEDKPVKIHKADFFRGMDDQLGQLFDQKVVHDDAGSISNADGSLTANHHWEYQLNDTGSGLEINGKLQTSALSNSDQLAWSYATMKFDSLYYDLEI